MHESMTDIIVKIGNFKRSIPKPSVLRNYEISKAEFDKNMLLINLVKKKVSD
jgi:arsenite-transporting ATPase